ncbi:sensor histidine kinase [Marmoricola sp. URHB0036]|uniref:sensor histidine kinase n=1 Tax=Marmoricola sp. URHB0036 TaxID=1298863 RepID=UPI0012DEEBDC|nr:histidine kinase [Marmoricola sp. URHB0036]
MGRPIPPGRFDVVLAGSIFVLGGVEMAMLRPERWGWGVAIELVTAVLLAFRRSAPLLVGTLAPCVLLVMPYVGPQLDEPAVPLLFWAVSVYTLARWVADLRGLVGVAVIALVTFSDYVFEDARDHNFSDVVFVATLLVPPYVFGRLVRRLAAQKALLEEREELVTREAVRAERDRIARELHDVIAHSVSAMVVQTAAAQDLVRTDPERAEVVLRDVADTGRRALAETGRLLHVIRDDSDELGLNPAPGVSDLERLVREFRAEGLHVELVIDEELVRLPAGIDVSAYRIAQEALTNALRYGQGTASLEITATGAGVAIRATNPTGPARPSMGSGLGLRGLAERVSLLGGTLTHGASEGCFELAATLPVERQS